MERIFSSLRVLGLLGLLAACLSGCAFLNINNQVNLARNSTILSGTVRSEAQVDGPVVVLAYSRQLGRVNVAHYAVLDQAGAYELLVENGDYYLFAFVDRNRNLQFDLDEHAAGYGRPDMLSVRDSGIITDLDLTIPESLRGRVDFPVGQVIADRRPEPFHSSLAGTIFSLDDPIYSLATAEQGYMEPVRFFRAFGGNIYFLEPYDPAKVPVLFVHGAMGSPENFRSIAGGLDKTRYQAWFYYYPSGSGLVAMANLLSKKIDDLQRMYGFSQLHLVAHSMGGLVSRAFLVNYGTQHPELRTFITLCTPWGGVEEAERGVATSPFVLSSWRDIAKGSAFIDKLYSQKLPETMAFYMFFGFRGDRVPWKAYNDGTITLQSQLDSRAQSEAAGTFGFNETHTSILDNHEVGHQIQALLDRHADPDRTMAGSGLVFRFKGLRVDNPPSPFLARLDHTEAAAQAIPRSLAREESLFLNPRNEGFQSVPVSPGRFQLGVMAWGYRADPERAEMELAPGNQMAVDIQLAPISLLSVRIRSRTVADRPALGLFQQGGESLVVQTLLLEGPGIRRELRPEAGDGRSFIDHYLDYKDYYAEGRAVFFELPPGRYHLTVQAAGHKTQGLDCEVLENRPGPGYSLALEKSQN